MVRSRSHRRPHARGLALLLLAVPAATGAVMMSPGWVSIAEGCSAFTNNIPGWQDFGVADQTAFPTNGALVLEGRFYQVDEATAAAAVSLTVTDDTGQSVAGTSQLIVTHPEASANPAKVVWKPDTPLAAGASYTVAWSVETQAPGGALTGSATLATAGGTAAASLPAATGSSSTAERVLGGDVVTCERAPNINACPPQSGTLTFGSKEIDRARAMLYWQLPAGPSP